MTKDNSKSITGPLSQKTEQLKEDIKINPNEKNRIYKIYNTKDIKKILRENNFPVKIIEKINEIYINDEDKQSMNIFKFKNKRMNLVGKEKKILLKEFIICTVLITF